MSSYERKVLGQIRDFLLQESLNQAKQFSQMQFTLNRLEKLMSTTSTVVQSILDNTAKTISDLGIATTDLKQLLADQATAITALQQQIAADETAVVTPDQLTTLSNATATALQGVDALDAAIKTADASLTAASAPAAPAAPADPAPVAADPAAPAAADPAAAAPAATSTLTPGGVLVHGQPDPNAPAT
jgi:hypothetical protein